MVSFVVKFLDWNTYYVSEQERYVLSSTIKNAQHFSTFAQAFSVMKQYKWTNVKIEKVEEK